MYSKNNEGPRPLPLAIPDTSLTLETTDTIYLDFLNKTGQKYLKLLKDHKTNYIFLLFKHQASMVNPVKGCVKFYLDKHNLTTPVKFHVTSPDCVQKSITALQVPKFSLKEYW